MSKTVIFGATGHMGQAIARQVVTDGKPIHLAGRDDGAVAALAAELGASASSFDLTRPDTLAQAVTEASTDGQLAGLVWAVGSILLKPLGRLTASDFVDTWFCSAQLPPRKASPAMPPSAQQRPALKGWQRRLRLSCLLMCV